MIYIPGYLELTDAEKKEICNGVGPSGLLGSMIPEFELTEEANVHDFGYYIANHTVDKVVADVVFFKNCWESANGDWIKQNIANQMFQIVLALGHRFTTHKIQKNEHYHEFQIKAKRWAYDHRNEVLSYDLIEQRMFQILVELRKIKAGT